jgi:hypothetical protein
MIRNEIAAPASTYVMSAPVQVYFTLKAQSAWHTSPETLRSLTAARHITNRKTHVSARFHAGAEIYPGLFSH